MFGRSAPSDRALTIMAIAGSLFFLPAPSLAQADQKLVVRCSNTNNWGTFTSDMVIDLAAQTVSNTTSTPNPGGSPNPIIGHFQGRVTQATDRNIRMDFPRGPTDLAYLDGEFVLDRYTGDLTVTKGSLSSVSSCQRQQKQF
jgi:hypothetical protein